MSEKTHTLTLEELAYCTGTTRVVIRQLVEEDLLHPVQVDDQERFDSSAFQPVKKMLRIHRHLDVDIHSLALVMQLLERIEALEQSSRSRS